MHDLGGTVLTKDNAQTILRGQSKTPNCFLLVKDNKDLVKRTMTVEERLQKRVAKNDSTTDLESSDTGQNQTKELAKKLSPAAIQFGKFAGSDFKFLKLKYLIDSLYSGSVIDPISYQLHPGSNFLKLFTSMTSDNF